MKNYRIRDAEAVTTPKQAKAAPNPAIAVSAATALDRQAKPHFAMIHNVNYRTRAYEAVWVRQD
jgi:hypothetical protein